MNEKVSVFILSPENLLTYLLKAYLLICFHHCVNTGQNTAATTALENGDVTGRVIFR